MGLEIVLESLNYTAGDQVKGIVRINFGNQQVFQGKRHNIQHIFIFFNNY